MNHNNFRENLSRANQGERDVGRILCNNIPNLVILDYNRDNKYDILTNHPINGQVTFEIKEDIKCAQTGNVVVEYESWGRPSGIMTTVADYWVFRIHINNTIEHYAIRTCKLKQLITENRYARTFQMTTTDSSNKVYFFRYEYLKMECFFLRG